MAGDELPPGQDERGPKDTVRVPPSTRTRIIARSDRPGRTFWHCHILSHEDHEMMRPFLVREGVVPDSRGPAGLERHVDPGVAALDEQCHAAG